MIGRELDKSPRTADLAMEIVGRWEMAEIRVPSIDC